LAELERKLAGEVDEAEDGGDELAAAPQAAEAVPSKPSKKGKGGKTGGKGLSKSVSIAADARDGLASGEGGQRSARTMGVEQQV
jgi:hypothetical protein